VPWRNQVSRAGRPEVQSSCKAWVARGFRFPRRKSLPFDLNLLGRLDAHLLLEGLGVAPGLFHDLGDFRVGLVHLGRKFHGNCVRFPARGLLGFLDGVGDGLLALVQAFEDGGPGVFGQNEQEGHEDHQRPDCPGSAGLPGGFSTSMRSIWPAATLSKKSWALLRIGKIDFRFMVMGVRDDDRGRFAILDLFRAYRTGPDKTDRHEPE